MPVLKIKKSDGTWQEVWGALSDPTVSAPRSTYIDLLADAWLGSSQPYSQVVSISGINANDKIDLLPTAQQILSLQNEDVSLVAENNNGILTIYSMGGKPSIDFNMQILITAVTFI